MAARLRGHKQRKLTIFIHFFCLSLLGLTIKLNFNISNFRPLSFRLIVIAEKDVVYNKFPIPLINRLEKHYLVTLTSLTPDQIKLVDKLKTWVSDFSEVTRENKGNR